jgi:hypothetical protein
MYACLKKKKNIPNGKAFAVCLLRDCPYIVRKINRHGRVRVKKF